MSFPLTTTQISPFLLTSSGRQPVLSPAVKPCIGGYQGALF